ncbi:hypothetical protein ASJ79_03950 [Mycobacterium sp. NAZ190054]|nr:hypothetical protein ASJ79_03950 [Mycobacterium sp. NAZ190054]
MAVILVFLVVEGLQAFFRGSYLTAAVWCATFGTPFLMGYVFFTAVRGGAQQRMTSDLSGLAFRPDKRLSIIYFAVMIVLVPAASVFAYLMSRGMLDITTTPSMQILMPPALWGLALLAASAIVTGIRRRGVGYLKFTPAMIEIANVIKTRALEWDDVVDVRDIATEKKANRGGKAVVLCLRDSTEEVVGGLHFYVPGGAGLYWLVRHYWKHLEDRDELVDGRAPQRLAEGKFDLG